jgi:hypothetical protein
MSLVTEIMIFELSNGHWCMSLVMDIMTYELSNGHYYD